MGVLSRHGRDISQVQKLSSGCKFPLLKHVVSHRREQFMILYNRNEELSGAFKVTADDFDYVCFISLWII